MNKWKVEEKKEGECRRRKRRLGNTKKRKMRK
jgi:hypothetical protein